MDYSEVITRFMHGDAPVEPARPEPIETEWRVILTWRPGGQRVEFQVYSAFSASEAYEYAATHYPNRKCWRVEKRYIQRKEASAVAGLSF